MASEVLSAVQTRSKIPALRLDAGTEFTGNMFRFQGAPETLQSNQERYNSLSRYARHFAGTRRPTQSYSQRVGTLSNRCAPFAEDHMLRRKTPNGTLNAAYDGSSLDGSTHPPASKHLLLPGAYQTQHTLFNNTNETNPVCTPFTPGTSNQSFRARVHESSGSWPAMSAWQDACQTKGYSTLPQVDSMLHGPTQQPAAMDWQYSSLRGPNVMQPPHQPPLGPTASHGYTPAEPIWPNGTFVQHQLFTPQSELQAAYPQTTQLFSHSNPRSDWPALPPFSQDLSLKQKPEHIVDPHTFGTHRSGGTLQPVDPDLAPWTYSRDSSQTIYGESVGGCAPYDSHRSPNDALLLGYQMYAALVSTIQGIRKNGIPEAKVQSVQAQAPLANIFPEPLRKVQMQNIANSNCQTPRRYCHQGSFTIHNSNLDAAPSQSFAANTILPRLQADAFGGYEGRRYNTGHDAHELPSNAHNRDALAALNRSIGPLETTLMHSCPQDGAILALNELTRICQQSNYEWTDGMLLCGSLSYALGDFQVAARWFSRILEVDSCHVEATSNFAATCLALNRRQEAEQYWRAAVHARPSYFEAVEHLVGLLCFDRRHKEAVHVIEHVQTFLRCRLDSHPSNQQTQYWSANHPNVPLRYSTPASENGRLMALLHAKGNILYNMQNHMAAAKAFEEVVLIAVNQRTGGIDFLIRTIISSLCQWMHGCVDLMDQGLGALLLPPEKAQRTAQLCFPSQGLLPGLDGLDNSNTRKAAVSVTSNSLLSLAKIFQDGMNPGVSSSQVYRSDHTVSDILALYYLSLSLQPSPSTANNVGILLASVPPPTSAKAPSRSSSNDGSSFPGVVPGSGVALALNYYKYGLTLDAKHAHLFTNLGSLLKDIGHLTLAIQMYERAVSCDANFDIALANLANAVKDQGKVSEAISYYKRAVHVSPSFAEAVCGLANALNSVCDWSGRGGASLHNKKYDRWHVNDKGGLVDALSSSQSGSGWIQRTVDIVDSQLHQGQLWGCGVLHQEYIRALSLQIAISEGAAVQKPGYAEELQVMLRSWQGQRWEGPRIVWLVERVIRRCGWQWYQDKFVRGKEQRLEAYRRPILPASLSVPGAPTVLPFHTFTLPMTAKQIRLISQRNGLRVSTSTLRAAWMPQTVYPPPAPPAPQLRVGYVSSDFNNHPLAHLMQSVFGMHNTQKVDAYCYATTVSDHSVHRHQIENEAPHFYDASSWPTDRVINQIIQDGIHILVNLNGYTRGARNEIFAARPAPLQMSFMGFAGTLGAEWCDYLLADETAVPPTALRPWRRNVDSHDLIYNEHTGSTNDEWVYGENIIYTRDTFFCCDHKQSGSSAEERKVTWEEEQKRRLTMRRVLFPDLPEDAVIFGNFNQLYKIDPTTFRTWLRILDRVPNSYLWLLRFPMDGAQNLLRTAAEWSTPSIASRILFTEVAPKSIHIGRACIADLFLDTPECNAHTTAADCLWSGTPLLTLPRYEWKMCSRMAAGILGGALDRDSEQGRAAWEELVTGDEEHYEDTAVRLGRDLQYSRDAGGSVKGKGRLMDLREMIWKGRWSCKLFDTRRWVGDLELAYQEAWRRWVAGKGGDIWLKDL